MTNFTNKMSLIEFQIHSASKILHLQVYWKDFCHKYTFADIGKQVESMIKSEKAENRQTTQGLASFCFFHQNICFFHVCLFPYKSQTSVVFQFNFSRFIKSTDTDPPITNQPTTDH